MAYLNHIELIGNLGKDAEVRISQNTGKKCVTMTVATSRKYKAQNGETREDTQWHNVVCWGRLADSLETLRPVKGTMVFVSGMVNYRKYEKDGRTNYVTEVVADSVQLLSQRQQQNPYSRQQQNAPQQTATDYGTPAANEEDDLPF